MTQTLVQGTVLSDRTPANPIDWISPGVDLWVASRSVADGVHFLGFVERSLDAFVAVDGAGASVGRHDDLESAQRAVARAHEPIAAGSTQWSGTGAPVLTVKALRSA